MLEELSFTSCSLEHNIVNMDCIEQFDPCSNYFSTFKYSKSLKVLTSFAVEDFRYKRGNVNLRAQSIEHLT